MYRSLLPSHRDPSRNSTDSIDSRSSKVSPSSTTMPRRIQPITVPEKSVPGHSPRFSKFLSDGPLPADQFVHDHEIIPAEATANCLRETRQRFAKKLPEDEDERKYAALDRQNVLAVYTQALDKLHSIPDKHIQIAAECTRKVRVILGIISADPADPVFTTNGQLLAPLEPQYANPRLEARDDPECYRAQWRLNRWRKEGWPHRYPTEAIRREEMDKGEKLVGRGCMSTEMLRKRSQEEDGIADFCPEEDSRRMGMMEGANKLREKNMVVDEPAMEVSVADAREWEDEESEDNYDSDNWS
jgi:hypothetical protein